MADDVEATTVGSIIGYLRLDDSDWNQKLDAAEARAEELGRTDPDIKVTADTAEAIAKIDAAQAAAEKLNLSSPGSTFSASSGAATSSAVAAAQLRLAAAEEASEAATNRAIIAQLRLTEAELNNGEGSVALAAAQEAARSSIARSELAATRAVLAEQALADVQKKEAAAALEAAGANEALGSAQKKAASSDSGGGGSSYYGMILAAVAALLPMFGPLSAAAVGTGASLAGMGVSGVLAYEGITKAMASGTAEGQQYSQGVADIKNVLDSLEGTAAAQVLNAFDNAVADVDSHVPILTTDVGLLSASLGTTVDTVLQGFLDGLSVMTPLIDDADKGVQNLAQDFDNWASGNGLINFVNYAIQELPIVGSSLGSLGRGVIDVVGDLAPLGNVMLEVVGAGGDVLSFLASLGPTLPIIAGGALAAYGAFQLWGTVAPGVKEVAVALDAVGAAETIADGPIGWIAAGLAALAVATGVMVETTNSNTAAVTSYTAALEQDNDAIGANVKATAAKALQDSGAFSAAKQLGVSYSDLTQAALGNVAAQQRVNDEIKAGTKAFLAAQAAQDAKTGSDELGITSQQNLETVIEKVRSAYEEQNRSLNNAINASSNIAAATDTVRAKQDTVATAIAWTTKQLTDQTTATTLLNNIFTLLDGGTLGVASANTALASASNAVSTSMRTNGTAVDGNTAKAVANQQAIEAQVQAAQSYAEAVTKSTGSTKDGVQAYEASQAAIEQQLQAQGQLTPAVKAYIEQLYDVPSLVNTVVTADTSQATAAIVALEKEWAKYPAYMQTAVGPNLAALPSPNLLTQLPGHAHGGTIGYLATGGTAGTVSGPGSGTSDSILRYLSNGEEVVQAQSAAYPGVRPLVKSLSQNPAGTMKALAGGAGNGSVSVSLEGAQFTMMIDGQAVTGVIQKQVVKGLAQQQTEIASGSQRGTF